MPRAATTVIKPFLPSSLPPPWSSHHTARLTRGRKLSGSTPPSPSPCFSPSLIFQFCQNAGGPVDSTDMARISSEFEKREERRSMTTQTLQTTTATTTTIRIFLIKVFFQWNLLTRCTAAQVQLAEGRSCASLCTVSTAQTLCSKVHCAQTIVHCAQPPQTIVHCEQAPMVMFAILILILDTSRR